MAESDPLRGERTPRLSMSTDYGLSLPTYGMQPAPKPAPEPAPAVPKPPSMGIAQRVGQGMRTGMSALRMASPVTAASEARQIGARVAAPIGDRVRPAVQSAAYQFGQGLAGNPNPVTAPPTPAAPARRSRLTPGSSAAFGQDLPEDVGYDIGPLQSTTPPTPTRLPEMVVRPLEPGSANTFTGPDGTTRRVQAATDAEKAADARRPATVYATPSTAGQVQESTARVMDGQRRATLTARADAAEILNPMSADAEIMRRLENSQSSFFNRGRPSARALQAEAYLGQLSARNRASATGQDAANATLQAGAADEGAANETAAERQQRAAEFNVGTQQSTLDREEAAAERELAARSPARQELIRGADGRVAYLRQDGTAATVRDEEGQPVLTPGPQEDRLSLQNLLESYNEQAAAVASGLGTPEEKRAQLEALRGDSLYQPLFARGGSAPGGASGPPQAAVDYLRANPAQAAAFDAKYGTGASARYLTR